MTSYSSNREIITKLMFRLLPTQITLAAVGAVNGIVSGYFATNYIGVDAMTAVGLYAPLSLFLAAIGTMLAGGSSILCGKYLGKNQQDKNIYRDRAKIEYQISHEESLSQESFSLCRF